MSTHGIDDIEKSQTASRKRIAQFFSAIVEDKKRKVDLEVTIARKRAELRRKKEEILKLQLRIRQQAQQLSAKETICDALEEEVERLQMEHGLAVD